MEGDILDPDGAHARLAAWKGRIDKLATDTQAMNERLSGARVSAVDPGGLTEVTVDSTGALVDLRLTDRIQRTAPDVVAQAILTTSAEARRQLADRSQEIIVDTLGADSPTGRDRRTGRTAVARWSGAGTSVRSRRRRGLRQPVLPEGALTMRHGYQATPIRSGGTRPTLRPSQRGSVR